MKFLSSILFMLSIVNMGFAQKVNYNLLIGTYTNAGVAKGIYNYNFNTKTGDATQIQITNTINPSFLGLSPDEKFLYAVNENGKTSTVSAYKYNKTSNKIQFLNKVASAGTDPCFISANDRHVFVSNYSSGSLAVFKRKSDGSLSDEIQVIQHTGKSVDTKGRQENAHVHMGVFSPDKKYFIVVDLGEDKVYTYKYNADTKKDILTPYAVYETTPGTGLRHIVFSNNGKFAYLVHEFHGRISALAFADGKFKKIQELDTAPAGFTEAIDGAEILLSADGKFLYQSNRGAINAISVLSVGNDGMLKPVEVVSSLGKGPRSFTIDPTGDYLLVGHQYTNQIVIFKRDKELGKLTDTGKRINLGAAVCLVFAK